MAAVVAMALGRDGHECETCAAPRRRWPHPRARRRRRGDRPQDAGHGRHRALRRLRAARPALPVILMTAHGSVPTAVEAMRAGAFDYVTKPFDNDELRALLARAVELTRLGARTASCAGRSAGRDAPDAIVARARAAPSPGASAASRRAAPRCSFRARAAPARSWSRAAALLSDRVGKPFVAVNCAALAEGCWRASCSAT